MKKRWIIIGALVVVAVILIVVLRKPDAAEEDYTVLAREIQILATKYDNVDDSQSARRMIAEIERVIDQSKQTNKLSDDLVIVPVQTERIKSGSIQKKLMYLGDIDAESSARVYAKIPDRIVDFPVHNGDFVKKGTVLAQVENSKLKQAVYQTEAALASARSQVQNLEIEYNRLKKLYDEKAVSLSQYQQIQTQFEVAKNGVKQAEAAYKIAREQLDDSIIKAPIDGFVSGRTLSVGDMAAGQFPLLTLSSKDQLKINVDVIERDLQSIRIGMDVNVFVDAIPGNVFNGKIARISPIVNPATRTGQVEILLENPDNLLKPGMFSRLEIIVESKDDVLIVNRNNVDVRTSRRSNGSTIRDAEIEQIYFVYVVKDSLALERTIRIGIESGMFYEVTDGLEFNDMIVSTGRTNLRDSTMVDVVKVNE
jgi:HlyD family secretion protein